ncbi:M14 family zinc carboxypeptidase [Propionivibrio sp.]|uniref:M14 family zinc carboxypeptidase n=1 Tax=Propionivibrio sp. TaxID=2212460 RepID=UPI0025CEC79A|nr:M14 family zinc carboxypeptidase [Propionivibrio sp.]MBK7357559.1 hypothetical protein [Propionivibrio sp.]
MPTITSTESCAAGRYVNLGSPSSQDDVGAQTIVAYCKPTGSGENGLGYLLSKATASHWLRFIVDHNGGLPRLIFGVDSSGFAGSPSAATNNSSITYGVNKHFAATWDGSLNKSGIVLYDDSGSLAIDTGIGANGSGTINSDAAGDLILLNRNSLNRAIVGDVYYISRWSRVLNWTELQNVFTNGPLAEPTGLILCWANQQDYSTLALTPTSRSTFVAGGAAPNTVLGPDSATVSSSTGTGTGSASGGDATGQIAGDVSGGTGVGTGSATGGDATAGGSATVSSSTGVGTGSASGGTPTGTDTTILSPVDRGNINLASSSVLNADTSTPTLNIVPRTMINDWLPAKSLQFHWCGAADKVNGKTPQFKVKFWTSTTHNTSTDIILYATDFPFNIAGGYRPEWSYDARTWYPFDNCVYDADNLHLRFYNNTAFTSDTVYYSTTTPWQESLTGEWLASLPTTYIQETASVTAYSGSPYIFGQSVLRVNELGEDIDACNLYAFKISSGSGLAPNGQPKKKFLVFAGNHAGEDPGNWALKGFVEFLIGTDAKAVTARQWLDFYVYPMICPAGRRGGHWRSDWEPGFLTYDANRHWTDSSMSTIVAFKNAIISDTGGSVAGGISFHSSFPMTTQTYTYPSGEVTALQSAITPIFGSLYPAEFYDIPSSSNGWMVNTLGRASP